MSYADYLLDQEEELRTSPTRQTDRVSVDLAALTVSQIKKWIRTPRNHRKKKKFIDGDHWQNGAGWVGPLPPLKDAAERRDALTRIRKAFTSQNACKEVTDRHVDAVAGNDPLWSFSSEEETKDEGEPKDLNTLMSEWWKDHKMHNLLQDALYMAKWANRAFLRRVVPPSRVAEVLIDPLTGEIFTEEALEELDPDFIETLEEGQVILDVSFEEAVDMIHVELIDSTRGAVVQDTETLRFYGFYIYKLATIEYAEVSYVDEEGLTHLRILRGGAMVSDVALDLGGHLFHFEVSLTGLITEQVMDLQRMLNKAYTMASINMDWSGFTERIFLNAQWPYTLESDGKGGTKKVLKDYQTGPSTTNWVPGITVTDPATGKKTMTTPEVKWRQPSDPVTFDKAKQMAYRGILQETRQLHALITGEATTTGESRKQALVEFNKSVEPTKTEADLMGRWLLDGQVRFARAISDDGPEGMNLQFQTMVEVGPLDANEVRLWNDVREKGGLTLKSFLTKLGVEDVDAESQALVNDPVYLASLKAERVEMFIKLVNSGVDPKSAATFANFEDSEAMLLSKNFIRVTASDTGIGGGDGGGGTGEKNEE